MAPSYGYGYDPREGDRIVDLMMAQGRIQAEGARRSGEIWGETLGNIGQIAGQAVQQHGEETQRRNRSQAIDALFSGPEMPSPQDIIRVFGPKDGLDVIKGLNAIKPEDPAGQYKNRMERFRDAARGIRALPPDKRPAAWAIGRNGLISGGIATAEEIPEQFDPDRLEQAANYGQEPAKATEGFTLSQGQQRFGADGQPIAAVPATAREPNPPAVGSFEDYAVQRFGPRPTSEQITQARKDYQQADDRSMRPIVPIVIQTERGPQLLDRSTGTVSDITEAGGNAVRRAPTADMRNKEAGRAFVGKSITAIEDLSKRILTRVGPGQRAEAIERGAEAVFGTDPEFRTYQDARMALAGNLAVAQQGSRPSDADIKAIWLPLVPDAYRDTSESAAMKWQLIKTMSNTTDDQPPLVSSPAEAAKLPKGTRFRSPDGKVRVVL